MSFSSDSECGTAASPELPTVSVNAGDVPGAFPSVGSSAHITRVVSEFSSSTSSDGSFHEEAQAKGINKTGPSASSVWSSSGELPMTQKNSSPNSLSDLSTKSVHSDHDEPLWSSGTEVDKVDHMKWSCDSDEQNVAALKSDRISDDNRDADPNVSSVSQNAAEGLNWSSDSADTESALDQSAVCSQPAAINRSSSDLSRRPADAASAGRIEEVCLHFLERLANGQGVGQLALTYPGGCNTYSIPLTRRYLQKVASCGRVLSDAHSLLLNNQWATKRDIFYQGKALYGKQWRLDTAVADACAMLQCPRVALHVKDHVQKTQTSTAKGLIFGHISWTVPNAFQVDGLGDITVDCSQASVPIQPSATAADGTAVLPQDYLFKPTDAKFVLIVEKDASFQKIMDDRIHELLGPCIVITGKGYPDLGTRALTRALLTATQLPAFALVDSDPAGYEIYLNYKHGPKKTTHQARNLELPELQLLGVLRSDADVEPIANDQFLPLVVDEVSKIHKLKERLQRMDEPVLHRELDFLLATGSKLEIEAVSGVRSCYLTDVYLRNRLQHLL